MLLLGCGDGGGGGGCGGRKQLLQYENIPGRVVRFCSPPLVVCLLLAETVKKP